MVSRYLVSALVILGSAALGLGAAIALVDGLRVESVLGFFLVVLVFTAVQAALLPIVTRLVGKHIPALEGGVGVISTLIALLIASLVRQGIVLESVSVWILGTLVIWLVTGLASAALSAWWRRHEEKSSGE